MSVFTSSEVTFHAQFPMPPIRLKFSLWEGQADQVFWTISQGWTGDGCIKSFTERQRHHDNTAYSKMAAIIVIFCLLANEPLLPRLKKNALLNF